MSRSNGHGRREGSQVDENSPVANFLPAVRYAIDPLRRTPEYRNLFYARINKSGIQADEIATAVGVDRTVVEGVFNRLTGIADMAEGLKNGGNTETARRALASAGKNLRAFAVAQGVMTNSLD